MENKNKKSFKRWILPVVVLVIAVVLIVNHYTVRQVWCNLFSPTLPLDETTDWNGRKVYEHLPYGTDSEAQ